MQKKKKNKFKKVTYKFVINFSKELHAYYNIRLFINTYIYSLIGVFDKFY